MAHANVESSPRLQAVLAALRRSSLTSIEIVEQAKVLNPAKCVSELNAQGFEIDCVFEGVSAARRRIFRYTLKSEPGGPKEIPCPGNECGERVTITKGKGWCPNHQMTVTIRG